MTHLSPKIAVVMATYNGELFLKEQLDSILTQTLLPYEIIIQDDCSQDDTWCILQLYRKRYPKLIKIYRNESSLGAHQNFIKAFQYVKSDYIAPCDQDDIWMPEKLERLYWALVEGGYSMVACKESILYEDGRIVPNFYPIPSLEESIFNHGVAGHLMMIPTQSIEVFEISEKITFDFGLTIYAICGRGGKVVDYEGCVWRRHSNVVTSEYSNHNPYKLEKISKWNKLLYAILATMKGVQSEVIEKRQNAIHQIIAHFAINRSELGIYDKLALNMMRQTPISLLKAGIILGEIKSHTLEYQSFSIKEKIANRLFNLCQPSVYWYDYHQRDAL